MLKYSYRNFFIVLLNGDLIMDKIKAKLSAQMDKLNSNALLLLFTIVLILATFFSSFQPIWGNIPLTIILPFIVLLSLKVVFFEKLKISTLIIIRVLILLPIFGLWDGHSFVKIILPFMGINILEASLVDFKRKKYYNAITGLALIATLFFMTSSWFGTYYTNYATNEVGEVCFYATWAWAIVYTIWNWFFICFEFKTGIAFLHVGILFAPVFLGIVYGPEYWMITRAYSLTFGGGVVQIFFKEFFERKFSSPKWDAFVEKAKNERVQLSFMIINLVLLASMYFIR